MSDEVGFLNVVIYESSVQIDSINFDGDSQASPKFPKTASLQCFYNI